MSEKQSISACACIGPVLGEPYCECRMRSLGLPLNESAREQAAQQLREALSKALDLDESGESHSCTQP
jgi:predicted Ser/Thr protein kinase